MKRKSLLRSFTACLLSVHAAATGPAFADDDEIEEIVVTADFRGRAVSDLPLSATVLDAEFIEAATVQHFEELVDVVPNLNWSGDGHRARYFQIRGVGELEQYQGAPNPSVGFLVDDIDFSGIGTLATMFDVASVDVLRGSQGSRYGANAIGGMVYVRSRAPSAERDGRLRLMAGGDDATALGLAFGGALDANDAYTFRVSAHQHGSDGFRNNSYLGRDDTNGRDETSVRLRLDIRDAAALDADLALLYSDIDNGYDAFALDSGFAMLSDRPGRDEQQSIGASLRLNWLGFDAATLTSITAFADSDIAFSFDADWGNADSWAPVTYDYVSISDRKRRTISQEFRLVSNDAAVAGRSGTDWLVGLYLLRLGDELATVNRGDYYDPFYDFADSLDDSFASDYESLSAALFGQVERRVANATWLGAGLRVERRTTDYSDTTSLEAGPSEGMWGGELTLRHDYSDALTGFVSLSRGYKAGGFNLGVAPPGRRNFEAEELWTVEAGIKSVHGDGNLRFNASVFYSLRDEQQVRTSEQLVPGDPASFVFFTDNAARGETIGLEADLRWAVSDNWDVHASIGLLDAGFEEFIAPQGDLSGRDQAHAPAYTVAVGAAYSGDSGFFARLDATAKDDFYFDVSHDRKSASYALLHGRIGYDSGSWLVQLWARNMLDEYYAVRGFFFGNEPPDFPNQLYTRPGDPRQAGITIEKRFE